MVKYFKFGTLAGVISAFCLMVYFGVSLLLGVNPLGGSKALSYFLMLILFFVSLWLFRTKILGGELHFHQGFSLLIVQHFICCLTFSLFVWGFLNLDKELLDRYREESLLVLQFVKEDIIKNRGAEAFEQGLNGLKTISAFDVAFDEFKKRFLVLLFFVLLASFMMRRSPNWSMSR